MPIEQPAHPGKLLRSCLPPELAITHAARRLGVTRQALSALINGRAGVSSAMALRLEAALGPRAELWLALQSRYDLWEARKRPPKIRQAIKQARVELTVAAAAAIRTSGAAFPTNGGSDE